MELSLGFHMIFAAVGMAIPLMMLIAEGRWLRAGDPDALTLAQTWAKVTAVLFAIGAVSGTALSFELGLLWPRFMAFAGPLIGLAFALEAYAFFIEAIFLGLYLYGWDRLRPFALAPGALALAVCAYLAAAYLTLEAEGELREDFRRRALGMWLVGGVISLGALVLASVDAPHLWDGLMTARRGVVVMAGVLMAPASALALWRRRFAWARGLAVAQAALLLLGWALAQWPYIIYPDVTIHAAAAPRATLAALLATLPFGLALLLPSLGLLFAVFKGRNPAAPRARARGEGRTPTAPGAEL